MSSEQREALGSDIEIMQVDRTINSAFEIKKEIDDCDIIAIVAPIGLQQQFLQLAGKKPVIMAVNERLFEEGQKVVFRFVKWERLLKIEVLKEDFIPE